MASWLPLLTQTEQFRFNLDQEHCVVFLSKTHVTLSVPLCSYGSMLGVIF